MKKQQIDADKICNHIKYTKHWLDKANTDFQEKRFANGSVVLNLARAELTAAWEDALQLKTQVFQTLPRKARANWKPLTSVGLLASGFLIALFITRLTTTQIPGIHGTYESTPVPVRQTAPAVIVEQEQPEIVLIEEQAPAAVETAAPATPAPVKIKKTRAVVKTAAPIKRTAKVIKEPEVLPYSPVGKQPAVKTRAPEPAQPEARELEQTEIIELFNTAINALND